MAGVLMGRRGVWPMLALAALGFAMMPPSAQAAMYVNARFGYSIVYPDNLLVAERESDNSDGGAFHARRGPAKMSVWGSYRDEDTEKTSDAIARLYETDCGAGKVTYRVVKPRLVAFSCVNAAGRIIYQKTLIDGDVLRSMRFEYPYADRATWDPVIKQVAGSLSAVPAFGRKP
ncbi:MAG TPA: hypothetical protein VGL35_09115 [Rhizomicrobium sp.]